MPATEMGAVFLGTDIILVHIPDIGSEIAHIGKFDNDDEDWERIIRDFEQEKKANTQR